jgi:Sulfotransferase family
MGRMAPDRKDTTSFAVSRNPRVRELVMNAYRYPSLPGSERARLQSTMLENVARFRVDETDGAGPFGWKMGTNIFTLLVFLDAFPRGRCVHLVRDGRDVMLSRLDGRFNFDDAANRLMVFGDEATETFLGRPLTPELVAEARNALEMRHWVTAVEYGLRGREFGDRYLEVRYEDLCEEPERQGRRIFDFLGVDFPDSTREWLIDTVSTARIGKWRGLPESVMEAPMAIGRTLLDRLGYP